MLTERAIVSCFPMITRAAQHCPQYTYIRGAKNKINVTLVLLVVAVHAERPSVFAAADRHPGCYPATDLDDTTAGTATSRARLGI